MADWLLLRLPRTPEEPATWLIASAAGAPLAATQSGALAEAAAAAYALEEQLADNIDELHFAIGRRAADSNRTPVAVVGHTLMNEWLAALRGAGLQPDCLYADSELLPANPGQAVVLLEEDTVFVGAPGAPPVSLPIDALAKALAIAESAPRA